MNLLTTHDIEFFDAKSASNYLSVEPEKQRIELSFLQRFVKAKETESAQELSFVAKTTPEKRFSEAYARMQSPIFRVLSGLLEQSVPEEKGFGKFRARD